MATAGTKPRVLLLTANPPSDSEVWIKKIEVYSQDLLNALRRRGGHADLFSFQDDTRAAPQVLSSYTHIVFINCDKYFWNIPTFKHLLENTLPAASKLNSSLRIHNPPHLTLWNCNKAYLQDLQSAGFLIPTTTFYQPPSSATPFPAFLDTFQAFLGANFPAKSPLVLKPSIAASGLSTHLLRTPHSLSSADTTVLQMLCNNAPPGSLLMLQEFMTAIQSPTGGEWSLIYVAGELTHAVLKRPREGEFRINSAFGGIWTPMKSSDERIPEDARQTAARLWKWLEERGRADSIREDPTANGAVSSTGGKQSDLLYARIDGVVDHAGKFMLMEVELIEPWLWFLENGPGKVGLDRFCDVVVGRE